MIKKSCYKILSISFILMLLFTFSHSISSSASEGFFGIVEDEYGIGINDAIVSFQGYNLQDWIRTNTDTNGNYELIYDNLEDHYSFAEVKKEGYKDIREWISIDLIDGDKIQMNFTLQENYPTEKPELYGPNKGLVGQVLTYEIKSFDIDDDYFDFFISWGNYDTTHIREVRDYETKYVKHSFRESGEYIISAYATDRNYQSMSDLVNLWVEIDGDPPSRPIISGSISGEIGVSYNYTFLSTDPDGSDIRYSVLWGDGCEELSNSMKSGEPWTVNHIYESSNNFLIKAQAIDEHGCMSEWGTLEVTMPRYKIKNYPILYNFFKSSLVLQQLLQRLLKLI